MKKISSEEFRNISRDAKVMEEDKFGKKVLLLSDGTYLKLFRIKRLLSSARIYSYAKRFANNAKRLTQLGIPTVKIKDLYRIPHLSRTAVHYYPLEGVTLRSLPNTLSKDTAEKLGRFIGELHDKGIYFRSLHLGNIVITPYGQMGLIDISDVSFHYSSLSKRKRLRNFHHTFHPEDTMAITPNFDSFLGAYTQTNDLYKEIRSLWRTTNRTS